MSTVNDVTNIISLVSSAAAILLMFVIDLIFNRVSLRFQRILSLIDFFRHLILIGIDQDTNSSFCVVVSFLGFYLDHLYILVNCIAALNFYIIFYHVLRPDKRIERMLLVGAILLPTIVDLMPFFFDFYGRTAEGICFLNSNAEYRFLFRGILLYAIQSAGMLFCLFIFFAVLKHLYYTKIYFFERFPDKTILLFGERIKTREYVIQLYRRVNIFYDVNGYLPSWMAFLSRFGVCFAGTLNLLALLTDPHFQLAIESFRERGLIYTHVSKRDLQMDAELRTAEELKEDECLVDVHHEESIEFRDLIKFV